MSTKIHPTALIGSGVSLGINVSVGPYTVIHDGTEIGDNSIIGPFCEIGIIPNSVNNRTLTIGSNSTIRSHATIYTGSRFGAGLETGHHVSLREHLNAGENLRVGSYSDLQGDMVIGDYVRLHSNVHLGKQTRVGNFVWIFPFVVTTNDPLPPSNEVLGCTIEDFAVVATASIILPGIRLGHDCLVGANSTVNKDVEPFSLVVGSPARPIKDVREVKSFDGNPGYPWRRNFSRGYPDNVVETWLRDFDETK